MSCQYTMPPLTVICSIFLPDQSRFAIGGEYDAPTFTRNRDPLNNTFQSIGSVDGQSFRVNRSVWGIYEEVRVPITSPTWNFWGAYSFEIDFAEREEWYSNNTHQCWFRLAGDPSQL